MSLSDLAALGSFVSGVAVLISLVFLFVQLRQLNEQARLSIKHTSAQLWQAASDRGVTLMLGAADPSVAAAHIVANGGTATPEAVQARQFMLETIATYQIVLAAMFQQASDELVEPGRLDRVRAQTLQLLKTQPGTRRLLSDMIAADAERKDPFRDFLKQLVVDAGG